MGFSFLGSTPLGLGDRTLDEVNEAECMIKEREEFVPCIQVR
jgi:hypothetical protein